MGVFAEDCASKYSFTREQQDAFSLESLRRARLLGRQQLRGNRPVTVAGRKGDTVIDTDEAPPRPCRKRSPP